MLKNNIKLIIDDIPIYEDDVNTINEKIKENHSIFKIEIEMNINTINYIRKLYEYCLKDKIFTISKVNKINQDQIDYIYKNCYIDKYTVNKKGYITLIIKNKLSKGELN